MDAHLLTKIIHMTAVAAALMVFVLRASTLFIGVQGEQPNPAGRKVLVALQHLSFTVVFITGAILLVMKNFQVQPWFYAKIILFFSVHDKFHRTLILSGFCLLKIAKISLNSSFFPKPIKR
ncbi:SirB2 family protein [Acinetobacter baumannii]|uniref:SirB2 family protein n=1 Tax=Acinetobacter baumannii TaxID=470 RepID=UPI003990BB40